ncbi:MAG: hypothetical protein ACRD4C_14920 [Candidatus Acidiferrales bacterium]
MPRKPVAEVLFGENSLHQESRADATEDKREYNREFMRRWRSDPIHQAREREKRRQWYYNRQKQRTLGQTDSGGVTQGAAAFCAFCWRPAVCKIARLRMCDGAPRGYVEVRIPYCGEC